MEENRARRVADALRDRGINAHFAEVGTYQFGVRVILPDGRQAEWDTDGTAGLEAQVMQDGEKAMFPYAQIDPTSTLYSQTFASKGNQLNQLVYNGIGDVVLGRSPMSAVDDVIRDWKSQGGDQMRGEFEQAIADARG